MVFETVLVYPGILPGIPGIYNIKYPNQPYCTLGQNQGVENSNSFYRHTRRTVGFYDKKNYD